MEGNYSDNINGAGTHTGIYTGRLRQNSGRNERQARERNKAQPKEKQKDRNKIPSGDTTTPRKRIPSKSTPTISPKPLSSKTNSPDIRKFINLKTKAVKELQFVDTMANKQQKDKRDDEVLHNSSSQEQFTGINPREPKTSLTPAEQTNFTTFNSTPGVISTKQTGASNILKGDSSAGQGNEDPTGSNKDKNPVVTPVSREDNTTSKEAEKMMEEEKCQIAEDVKKIATLKKKVETLKDGTMERMLLEMQIDTKLENLKTRKMMCLLFRNSNEVSNEVSANKSNTSSLTERIIILEETCDGDDVKSLKSEVTQLKSELSILAGVVKKQSMKIGHLETHNETKVSQKIKHDLIIQGLETENSDTEEELRQMVTGFFKNTMKIHKNIALKSVVKLSNRKPSALQVTLTNLKDKSVIFKNVKNIIGLKNSKDESYYVNNHLTYEGQEEQKRYRKIKKMNKDVPATDLATITFSKGKMLINNEPYKKRITAPSATDIISPEEIAQIEDLYQTVGETIRNGECLFTAISQEVKNINEVRLGYIKARRLFPDALHVICIYFLPGQDSARCQDFCEDGETGAGNQLLDLMTENNLVHRALYIARYYGGKHLGPSRFQSYKEAMSSAISRSSYNSIIKKNQFPLKPKSKYPRKDTPQQQQDPKAMNYTTNQPRQSPGYASAASPMPYNGIHTASPIGSPNIEDYQNTNIWGSRRGPWGDPPTGADNMEPRHRAGSFPSLQSTMQDAASRARKAYGPS